MTTSSSTRSSGRWSPPSSIFEYVDRVAWAYLSGWPGCMSGWPMCMSGWPRRTCQGGPRRLTGCLEACRVGVGHLITFDWAAWVPITFDQPWVDRVPVKLRSRARQSGTRHLRLPIASGVCRVDGVLLAGPSALPRCLSPLVGASIDSSQLALSATFRAS